MDVYNDSETYYHVKLRTIAWHKITYLNSANFGLSLYNRSKENSFYCVYGCYSELNTRPYNNGAGS